jgi:transposase-like protein
MAKSVLSASHFHSEDAAFNYVEAHLWPNGPTCPHCGNADASKIGRLAGKTTRAGLRKCYACRKPFTVRHGTIFEDSHLGLRFWLQAIHLMCASKKGISTRQLQRVLGCGMKTAWHLGHRIRHAMAPGSYEPMGGAGSTIEIDETYVANSRKTKHVGRRKPKMQVFALVDRESGQIRSMLAEKRVAHLIPENINMESRVVSDNAQYYKKLGFAKHETVDHSKFEWARGDVHTNNLEGFFSIFKRGLVGTYQHMDKKHVDRYLAEFDFRHNNRIALGVDDTQRASNLLKGVAGKRLTYQTTQN